MEKTDITLYIIEHNLKYLSTLTDLSMLWWVSSTALFGAIIGATYINRREIYVLDVKYRHLLFSCVFLFFFIALVFGISLCVSAYFIWDNTYQEIHSIQKEQVEILTFPIYIFGCALGTTSFLIALILWIGLWRIIVTGDKNKKQDKPSYKNNNN